MPVIFPAIAAWAAGGAITTAAVMQGMVIVGAALQVVGHNTDNDALSGLGKGLMVVGAVGGLASSLAGGAAEATTAGAASAPGGAAAGTGITTDAVTGVTASGTGAVEPIVGTPLTSQFGSGTFSGSGAFPAQAGAVDAVSGVVNAGTGLATDSVLAAPTATAPVAPTAGADPYSLYGGTPQMGVNTTQLGGAGTTLPTTPPPPSGIGGLINKYPGPALMLSQGVIGAYGQHVQQEAIDRARREEALRRQQFNDSVLNSRIQMRPWETTPTQNYPVYGTPTTQPAGRRPLIATAQRTK